MTENNFGKRLLTQIKEGINRYYISMLRELYHTDALGFVGLSILSIVVPLFLFLIIVIGFFLTSSQHDIESYSSLMNTTSPIVLILFILFAIGLLLLMGGRIMNPSTTKIFIPPQTDNTLQRNRKIFVVHGHDSTLKTEVELYLRTLLLDPIILHQQVSRNKTIIEKVEYYSDVSFAVILLTSDDVGAEASIGCNDEYSSYARAIEPEWIEEVALKCQAYLEDDGIILSEDNNKQTIVEIRDLFRELKLRSRQNVLFECGYFIGKLGRENVAILCDPVVEIPTDLNGLCYLKIEGSGSWRKDLAMEINAAGIKIDEKCMGIYEKMKSYLMEHGIKELKISCKTEFSQVKVLISNNFLHLNSTFINDMKSVGFGSVEMLISQK